MNRRMLLYFSLIVLILSSTVLIPSCKSREMARSLPSGEYQLRPTGGENERAFAKNQYAGYASEDSSSPDNAKTKDTNAWQRKQIITANIVLESKDVRKTAKEALKIALLAGGYSSGASFENNGYDEYIYRLTVKIPEPKFQTAFEKIKGIAKLKSESTNADDVTEEYIDVNSRIKNFKKTETRLLEILQKANSVDDILKVEEQLGRVRQEIETLTGRKQYLDNATSYCALNIEIHPPQQITVTNPDQWNVSETIKGAARAFLAVCRSLLTVIIYFVVFIPVIALFYILIRILKGMIRKRKERKLG